MGREKGDGGREINAQFLSLKSYFPNSVCPGGNGFNLLCAHTLAPNVHNLIPYMVK